MNVAVLFSGGKDSTLALYYALKKDNVKCLISIISKNPESYMFHTPNINLAEKQAEAIGLPVIIEKTKGEKEKELDDLERAMKKAIEKYGIKGIYTGALASVYQKSRVEKICEKLNIECISPLWQKNQFDLLDEIVKLKFEVIIIGVAAEGLDNFIGKNIDKKFIDDIRKVYEKFKINPAGEGGEYETFVLNAPFFKKRLKIVKSHIEGQDMSKILIIDEIK